LSWCMGVRTLEYQLHLTYLVVNRRQPGSLKLLPYQMRMLGWEWR